MGTGPLLRLQLQEQNRQTSSLCTAEMWWGSPPQGSRLHYTLQERGEKSSSHHCEWNCDSFQCSSTFTPTVSDSPVELLSQTGCRAALKAFRDVRLWTSSRESALSHPGGWCPAHWQKQPFAAEAHLIVLRAEKRSHWSKTRCNTPENGIKNWSNCYQLQWINVTELSFCHRKQSVCTGRTGESQRAWRLPSLQHK